MDSVFVFVISLFVLHFCTFSVLSLLGTIIVLQNSILQDLFLPLLLLSFSSMISSSTNSSCTYFPARFVVLLYNNFLSFPFFFLKSDILFSTATFWEHYFNIAWLGGNVVHDALIFLSFYSCLLNILLTRAHGYHCRQVCCCFIMPLFKTLKWCIFLHFIKFQVFLLKLSVSSCSWHFTVLIVILLDKRSFSFDAVP